MVACNKVELCTCVDASGGRMILYLHFYFVLLLFSPPE